MNNKPRSRLLTAPLLEPQPVSVESLTPILVASDERQHVETEQEPEYGDPPSGFESAGQQRDLDERETDLRPEREAGDDVIAVDTGVGHWNVEESAHGIPTYLTTARYGCILYYSLII